MLFLACVLPLPVWHRRWRSCLAWRKSWHGTRLSACSRRQRCGARLPPCSRSWSCREKSTAARYGRLKHSHRRRLPTTHCVYTKQELWAPSSSCLVFQLIGVMNHCCVVVFFFSPFFSSTHTCSLFFLTHSFSFH